MGLGISIKGRIRGSAGFSDIERFIVERSSGLFKEFLSFEQDESSLQVFLHPGEEPVYFDQHENNAIICSARTNSVGPGYHAYLVELIEDLGRDIGIDWHWDLEEGEDYYQDETGYYANRDYAQLQIQMLQWLKNLCQYYHKDEGRIMVSLPAGFPRIKHNYFAISPIKMWSRDWFEKVSNSELETLHRLGEEFFIWWNKEPDARFFQRTGIALLNVDCPWHFAVDEKERKILSLIDQCFAQVKIMEPSLYLPIDDWMAVQNLLSENDVDIPQTDYGYRKHTMTFDLPGDWLIDLPGTLYKGIDGNSLVYYDNRVTVRSVAYGISKDKSDAEYAETFFDNNKYIGADGTEVLYSIDDLAGKAIIYYNIDHEANSEYWILQGVKVKGNDFLLSTICYSTDEYKERAIEIWNSVRR